jgi:multisubunit Na+/H+ antiporter MnhB subunit
MTSILTLFVSIIAAPLCFLWCGFVLSKLWLWFVVPSFGFPALAVVNAAGICIIIKFIKGYNLSDEKDVEVFKAISLAFAFPLIVLFIGWILHHA